MMVIDMNRYGRLDLMHWDGWSDVHHSKAETSIEVWCIYVWMNIGKERTNRILRISSNKKKAYNKTTSMQPSHILDSVQLHRRRGQRIIIIWSYWNAGSDVNYLPIRLDALLMEIDSSHVIYDRSKGMKPYGGCKDICNTSAYDRWIDRGQVMYR